MDFIVEIVKKYIMENVLKEKRVSNKMSKNNHMRCIGFICKDCFGHYITLREAKDCCNYLYKKESENE